MTELLETEGAKTLLEGAEERGWVMPAELEAFALEHELSDLDVEELTRELERIGLGIGGPPGRWRGGRGSSRGSAWRSGSLPQAQRSRTRTRRSRSRSLRPSPRPRLPALPTACSSSSPTRAATSF